MGSATFRFDADATFIRYLDDGTSSQVTGYFHSNRHIVSEGQPLDVQHVVKDLNEQVENFTKRGSGYVLEEITRLTLVVVKYRPLGAGSSYVPTPKWLRDKHSCINVKNSSDECCFKWALLSAIYPAKDHPDRLSNYLPYENRLDFTGLTFPMPSNKISQFERQNPDVAVHVLAYDESTKSFIIVYLSNETHRPHVVPLLLLDSDDGEKRRHYVWITNLSALVCGRIKKRTKSHVCISCLQIFSSQRVLDEHSRCCLMQRPQQTIFPNPRDPKSCKLSFRSRYQQFPLPFYLVADFESFLTPTPTDHSDDDGQRKMRIIDTHEVSGFCVHRVSQYDAYQTAPFTYSGDDPIGTFYRHIFAEARNIGDILSRQTPMHSLTPIQQKTHDAATMCHNCRRSFTSDNIKTRHHDHITGDYLFAACNDCNLALKPRKCKVLGNREDYLIPLVMHNMSYDSHFFIRGFQKAYTQYVDDDGDGGSGSIRYDDVKLIPLNSEKSLQVQIGNVLFLDSFQFLSASLDTLVATLAKSGKEKFRHTTRYVGERDYLFQKGVFCYNYMTDRSKFDDIALPPKDEFYNHLIDEPISDDDYARALAIWSDYDMKNLRQYHDFYLTTDVLLLTDVFQSFRETMLRDCGLDCLHFPSLPSMSLQMALKMTDVELDLICDPDIYLTIESGIRGGMSYVAQRYARANEPSLPDYRPDEPTSHLAYWDCNSLYATCQTYPLPVGNFRFLSSDEIHSFDLFSIGAEDDVGFILDVDLHYPVSLHDVHNEYPLAVEHLEIMEDMLSPTVRSLLRDTGSTWRPSTKLCPNFYDKTHYVVHYRCLQFYVTHGLQVVKIHSIISFTQRPFMRPFIEYCNDRRKTASGEFEVGLYKLFANAVFGKTCENVRNRENIRLIADPNTLVKAASKATFRRSEIINDDLVLVRAARPKVMLNKPIAIGFTILEVSKLIMYEFFYDCLKPKYGDKIRLCFTDTDSLICHIETPDLHDDMAENAHWFDTSNFRPEHPLFSMMNKRVLGKFKSETADHAPFEFCGLRSKMYSLYTPSSDSTNSYRKAKGVPKSYVKKNVRHEDYLRVLNQRSQTSCKFRSFRSHRHVVTTREMTKKCLSCIDDKRFLLDDNIHSLAYGHRDTVGRLPARAPFSSPNGRGGACGR